jgi:hypothetical protein
MYDIIGDIHGHADELRALLERLGYSVRNGTYKHSDRKVIFLGDLIDRGPKIGEVLRIVRDMVESGEALCVMGNHEFNALCYHTPDPDVPGEYLRAHKDPTNEKHIKHREQHEQTVFQLSDSELEEALHWFRTLPPAIELLELRAVHACWAPAEIAFIQKSLNGDFMSDEFLIEASKECSELYSAVEFSLKGAEIPLPDGVPRFIDKEGKKRDEIRIKWWEQPCSPTYSSYVFPEGGKAPDLPIPDDDLTVARPYGEQDKPVFFGHYWVEAKTPSIQKENVCCLDYSVAKKGYLCAYRFNGESALLDDNFVWG